MKYRLVFVRGNFTVRRGNFGRYGNWEIKNFTNGVRLPCRYPLQVLSHILSMR